jgi:hypothetical protein
MIAEIFKNNFNLIEHRDSKLEYIDRYFTDPEEKKFIFLYSHFDSFKKLKNNWKQYQNQDIAAYLQNKKYSGNDIRWDIYYILFYQAEETSPAELYSIERDKHICRKLIIEYQSYQDLIDQLKFKLPFNDNFYNISGFSHSLKENIFEQNLLRKFDFSVNNISQKELRSPLAAKEKVIKSLKNGGELTSEKI